MNRTTVSKSAKRLALGLVALALAATPSFAQTTYDLCATTGTVVMPGGSVDIWGYVLGTSCSPGTATIPGPVIRATAGETLTINLTNNLGEPVSFFVPGLPGSATGGTTGRFTNEAAMGGGTASYSFTPRAGTFLYHSATDRIRTQVPMGLYGALVVDSAALEAYPDDPLTLRDESVAYVQDQVLVYSEIDPALNADPIGMDGAKVINWVPQYFLINGQAYPNTVPLEIITGDDVLLRFVNAGLDSVIPTLGGGLYMDLKAEDGNRYPHPIRQYGLELQAGKTIDAMIQVTNPGTYAIYDRSDLVTNGAASGGGMLTYLDATAAVVPETVNIVYSEWFPGSETLIVYVNSDAAPDAVLTFPEYGDQDIPLFPSNPYFDYAGNVAPVPEPATVTVNSDHGGSDTKPVPYQAPPIAVPDEYSFVEEVLGSITAPGVLSNDGRGGYVNDIVWALEAELVSGTTNGTLTLNADGSFTYQGGLNFNGVDSFSYRTNAVEISTSTVLATSDPATVTLTVTPANDAPVAVDDAYVAPEGAMLTVAAPGVLANDEDVDGDALTASQTGTAPQGVLVLNSDGSFDYTPFGVEGAIEIFEYFANDGTVDSTTPATVTITVGPPLPNVAPIANDDTTSSQRGITLVAYNIVANDDDGEGNIGSPWIDATSVVITTGAVTQRGGTVINNGDGTINFTPVNSGWTGTDTFQYTVEDDPNGIPGDHDGLTSNVATVRINVVK